MSASSGYGTGGSTPVGPVVETLTGNSGGPVGPTANNINILGAGGVLVAGNPGTSTLTITVSGIATLYTEDVGTAAPSAGNLNIFGGASTAGINIHTFGSGNTVDVILNDSLLFPITTSDGLMGVLFMGGHTWIHNFRANNCFLGIDAGNLTMASTSNANTGIGVGALGSLAGTGVNSATSNTGVGLGSLGVLTDGSFNCAFADNTADSLTTGNGNVIIGHNCALFLVSGNTNVLIGGDDNLSGLSCARNYTGSESSNIIIQNVGVTGENNTMRLGTEGVGDADILQTFIAGIYNKSFASPSGVVQIDSTSKLGSSAGTDGQILIGSTGASPAWSTITAGANIAIVNAANSITISASGAGGGGAVDFPCDTGTAVESGGVLNVLSQAFSAFNNMSTAGSGNTVFVRLKDAIALPATNAGATAGVLSIGGNPFVQGLGANNTFIGNAGNLTLNTGSATEDTAVGSNALHAVTTGAENTVVGGFSGNLITTGSNNTALGFSALDEITTGSGNIAIGVLAGSDYTSSESNNIAIGNLGTLGESGIIRIGRSPTHTAAYMAGVYNASIGATNAPVFIDNTGKLGTLEGGVSLIGSSFLAFVDPDEVTPFVAGVATTFVGSVQAMNIVYDNFGTFNAGPTINGAFFTVPIDGYYSFNAQVSMIGLQTNSGSFPLNGILFKNGAPIVNCQGRTYNVGAVQQINRSGAQTISITLLLTAGDVISFGMIFVTASSTTPTFPGATGGGVLNGAYQCYITGTLVKTAP